MACSLYRYSDHDFAIWERFVCIHENRIEFEVDEAFLAAILVGNHPKLYEICSARSAWH